MPTRHLGSPEPAGAIQPRRDAPKKRSMNVEATAFLVGLQGDSQAQP